MFFFLLLKAITFPLRPISWYFQFLLVLNVNSCLQVLPFKRNSLQTGLLRREQLLFVRFWVLEFNEMIKCKCFIVCVHTQRILMVSLMVLDCLNAQLTQTESVMIRTRTKAALIKCEVDSTTFKSNALHWYKAPPKGALQRLIYFEAGSKIFKRDPDAPRKITGSVNDGENNKPVTLTLTIPRPERSDEGSYYCALWSEDNTVLTVRGNHGKNLLSSSKLLLEQMQQGRH